MATEGELLRFHTPEHVRLVKELSVRGTGCLDAGDTPAFKGMFEASSFVVGSTLNLLELMAEGSLAHGLNPMGGLHHARRGSAAGFCVFNDIGVAIATAKKLGLSPVLYVDMDAHHGDGVFYSFEDDPEVFIVDLHEDGRFLYPGTGKASETGSGAAVGTKVNIELQPGAGDGVFMREFDRAVEEIAERAKPALVVFQCGADSLGGDPLTHLELTPESHRHATTRLAQISHRHSSGRLLALGGGGYNPANAAEAWLNVASAMADHP